jgi:hypothetical protein
MSINKVNSLIMRVNKEITSFYSLIKNDSQALFLFKISAAFSTMTYLLFIYLVRKNKRLTICYFQDIGYLRLLKPDVNKYEMILKSQKRMPYRNLLNSVIKEFHALPNGITNFGNNCYINVLFQVN